MERKVLSAVLVLGAQWLAFAASAQTAPPPAAPTPAVPTPAGQTAEELQESRGGTHVTPTMAKTQGFLGKTEIGGFVSGGYLYRLGMPRSGAASTGGTELLGRSFDNQHNEVMLNKFKLTFENPVEYSAEKWDAGFRADLLFGQDAKTIQANGLSLGNQGDVEQAYVTVNAPIGRGLQISVGKWVTLQGIDLIEEVANPTWSAGNQFLFLEAFTMTGVQLSYHFTDTVDAQLRMINGWDQVKDVNNGKSFLGRIGWAPSADTSVALLGSAGPEQAGNSSNWRYTGEMVVTQKLPNSFTVMLQGDWGREERAAVGRDHSDWYAGGLWFTWDASERLGLAFRGDWMKDIDGTRTALWFARASGVDETLASGTLTANWKPVENLQVRPEVRLDHASQKSFEGQDQRITLGCGVAYLF